jgi:hypothetical protein
LQKIEAEEILKDLNIKHLTIVTKSAICNKMDKEAERDKDHRMVQVLNIKISHIKTMDSKIEVINELF